VAKATGHAEAMPGPPQPVKDCEVICRSCNNRGVDFLGKPCTCQNGQKQAFNTSIPLLGDADLAHCIYIIAEVERTLAGVRSSLTHACGQEGKVMSDQPCGDTNGYSEQKYGVQWDTNKTEWDFDTKLLHTSKARVQFLESQNAGFGRQQQRQQEKAKETEVEVLHEEEPQSVTHQNSTAKKLWFDLERSKISDQAIFQPNFADQDRDAIVQAALRVKSRSSARAVAQIGFRHIGCTTSGYAIHPESKFRMGWLVAMYFFLVYEAITIPFYLAYDIKAEGFAFLVASVINTYFLIDMAVSCFTGYFEDSGQIVMRQPQIVKKYLASWFVFDVVASIPWEWLSTDRNLAQFTKGVRSIRAIRLVRVARLFRLMRSNAVTEKLEMVIEANQSFTFFFGLGKVVFLIFFVTHWAACLWYAIGSRSVDAPDTTWVETYVSDRWAPDAIFERYLISIYFALTTMTTVGYGDMSAQNIHETLFVVALLLVASIVFAGLMGVLTDLIANLNNETNIRNDRKAQLSRYMQWRAVPHHLFSQIRQHMIFLWEENCGYEDYEENLKSLLPPMLREELCYHMYGRLLQSSPFLGWMRGYTVCIKSLANNVHSLFLAEGDLIVHLGQSIDQIFLLLSGDAFLTRNPNFADDSHKQGRSENELSQIDGFAVPRQKKAPLKEVAVKQAEGFVQRIPSAVTPRPLSMREKLEMFAGPAERVPQTPEETQSKALYGVLSTGNPMFDSQSMVYANIVVKRRDQQMNRAARVIQKRWRAGKGQRSEKARSRPKRPKGLKNKRVTAPAYFGESCLWVPRDDWGIVSPPRFSYSARCQSRCEVVCIPQQAVRGLVETFSPWLGERLDTFREAISTLQTNLAEGNDRKAFPETEDCFAMDLAAADEGLNASHCKVLLKTASMYGHRPSAAAAESRPSTQMPRAHSRNFADYSSARNHRFRRTSSSLGVSRRP